MRVDLRLNSRFVTGLCPAPPLPLSPPPTRSTLHELHCFLFWCARRRLRRERQLSARGGCGRGSVRLHVCPAAVAGVRQERHQTENHRARAQRGLQTGGENGQQREQTTRTLSTLDPQAENGCSPSLSRGLCACRQDAEGGRMGNAIKRSINLALSHRGICALQAAGLSDSQHSSAMHRLARCMAWRSLELSLPVRAALPLPVTSFR